MASDELLAEGEATAKRCFALAASGAGQVMGYWGGARADLPDQFPPEVKFSHRRHIASVDGALLAQLGADAPALVSLYEWIDRDVEPHMHVETDARKPWATLSFSGEALYATERVSFPPFEALCLHGSARVGDWLGSLGLRRYQYWKVPREIVMAYDRHYQVLRRPIREALATWQNCSAPSGENGAPCAHNGQCHSFVCQGGLCRPPQCAPSCNRGAPCGADDDCGSDVCSASGMCAAPLCSPHCSTSQVCGDNSDCFSFVCTNNLCAPSACAPRCNTGAPCGSNADCSSRRCTNGICARR